MALSDNIIFDWRLNEAVKDGTASQILDSSSNGRTGTSSGDVTNQPTAKLNAGATFGTTFDRILSDDNLPDFTDFSFNVWANITTKNAFGAIFCHGNANNVGRFNLWNSTDLEGWKFWLIVNSTFYSIFSPTSHLTTDGWTMVTCTFKYSTGLMTLYVNGVSKATANHTGTFDAVQPVAIGAHTGSGGSTESYTGDLDQATVWDIELQPADVTSLYNGGAGQEISYDTTPPTIGAPSPENTTTNPSMLIPWTEPEDADYEYTEMEIRVNAGTWNRVLADGTFADSGTYGKFAAGSTTYDIPAAFWLKTGLTLEDTLEARVRAVDTIGNVSDWSVSTAVTVANAANTYYFVDNIPVTITDDTINVVIS